MLQYFWRNTKWYISLAASVIPFSWIWQSDTPPPLTTTATPPPSPSPGDFLCTCAFPSFVACSRFGSVFNRGAKFVRSVLFALEALTRVFHRWFYGRRAKVGIMQRGELLQRKLPTCCVKEVESGFYKYTNTNIQKQKHKLQ